jgi:hypothetical protein
VAVDKKTHDVVLLHTHWPLKHERPITSEHGQSVLQKWPKEPCLLKMNDLNENKRTNCVHNSAKMFIYAFEAHWHESSTHVRLRTLSHEQMPPQSAPLPPEL